MDWSRFREATRQGCLDPWASTVHWKDSPSAPPAPNYQGAAEAQAASQRTSQYTPYGSQVYTPTGYDPQGNLTWRSDINLTPQSQHALDSQMAVSQGMGDLAQQQLPQVQQQYSHPMDLQSVQDVNNQAYAAQTARLDPQWNARQQQFDAQMANQGIPVGSEAYNNANREFQQSRNDAYQQANLAAIQTMPQTYQLASAEYNQPLNTLNAIRSGVQIQNPTFGSTPSTNYLNAAQAQGQYDVNAFNAMQGGRNAMMGGLFGLGAAGINAFG